MNSHPSCKPIGFFDRLLPDRAIGTVVERASVQEVLGYSWTDALSCLVAVRVGDGGSGADHLLLDMLGAADLAAGQRQRVHEAIFASPSLPQLRLVAETEAGRRAIVRGTSFGFGLHGEQIFTAIAQDHLAEVPERAIAEHPTIAEQVAAARRFLMDELGRIWGAHMEAMFASVDDAVAVGRSLTVAERNFLDHELLEASLVAEGMTQYDAHHRVHETIPPGANFAPHVIVEFQDRFGPENFRYWGLTKGGR